MVHRGYHLQIKADEQQEIVYVSETMEVGWHLGCQAKTVTQLKQIVKDEIDDYLNKKEKK